MCVIPQLPLVIWGSKGHAKVLNDLVVENNGNVVALIDSDPSATPAISGVPLCLGLTGFAAWLSGQSRPASSFGGAVAIGGERGHDRLQVADIFQQLGLTMPLLQHASALLSPQAHVSDGVQLLAYSIVAAGASVGRVCILNHGALLDHESVLGAGSHLAPRATVCGCVTIGERVMIGAGAVVLPYLNVGHDVVIGAGAVVTRDVPPFAVVAGNPARVMSYRPMQQYNPLSR